MRRYCWLIINKYKQPLYSQSDKRLHLYRTKKQAKIVLDNIKKISLKLGKGRRKIVKATILFNRYG